jgi:hypothetical protein
MHEDQRRKEASSSLQSTANLALYWGIGGLVGCLCFIPSCVALVMGFRARTMARKYALVLPVNATAGLVLGFLGLLFGAGLISLGVISDLKKQERIEALDRQLRNLDNPKLDHATACGLVEKRLLQKGFAGDSRPSDIECDGKLVQNENRASLENVRFTANSNETVVRACLEYGARWSVLGFRKRASCDEPDDTAAAAIESQSAGTLPSHATSAPSAASKPQAPSSSSAK